MKRILVTYATYSGSTGEIAEAIAGELTNNGNEVVTSRIEEATSLDSYDAFIIGAPMITRWHDPAIRFIKKNRDVLRQKPVAYFFTAMSLTQTGETNLDGVQIYTDTALVKAPRNPHRLGFKENYATIKNYLRPVLKSAPEIKPVSAGFFGGKLEYFTLKWYALVFVMLIIQASPGDKRNWDEIKTWASGLPSLFFPQNPQG